MNNKTDIFIDDIDDDELILMMEDVKIDGFMYKYYIQESVESVRQLPNVTEFAEKICDDIKNERYLKRPLYGMKPSEKTYYTDVLTAKGDITLYDIYVLEYRNLKFQWMKNLDIIVKIPSTDEFNVDRFIKMNEDWDINIGIARDTRLRQGEAHVLNNDYTIYGDNTIEYACITIINPSHIQYLNDIILHEIHHYYDGATLYTAINVRMSDYGKKNAVFFDVAASKGVDTYVARGLTKKGISRIKEVILNNKDKKRASLIINQYFAEMCYFLSKYEMLAHRENILGEYIRYLKNGGKGKCSLYNKELDNEQYPTFHTYKMIDDILHIISITDKETCDIFFEEYGNLYYNIFERERGRYKKEKNNLKRFGEKIDEIEFEIYDGKMTVNRIRKKFEYKMASFNKSLEKLGRVAVVLK